MRAATPTSAALAALLVLTGAGANEYDHTWTRPPAPLDALYDMAFYDYASLRGCVGMNTDSGGVQCFQGDGDFYTLKGIETEEDWDAFLDTAAEQPHAVVITNATDGAVLRRVVGAMREEAVRKRVGAVFFPLYDKAAFLGGGPAPNATGGGNGSGGAGDVVGFSPQAQQPNAGVDLYEGAQPLWNKHGMGLHGEPLPLLGVLNAGDHMQMVDLVGKRGGAGVQANYEMRSKGKTAIECLNDGLCDLLGQLSVWGTSVDLSNATVARGKKFIAVTLPISGTSLFTDTFVPADGAVLGSVVAALAVVDAIAPYTRSFAMKPLFAFLENEQHGAAGGFRFLHDLHYPDDAAGDYPASLRNYTRVDPHNIAHLIALDQLGVIERGTEYNAGAPPLYAYYDQALANVSPASTQALLNTFTAHGGRRSSPAVEGFLPPSAAHAFLQMDGQRNRSDLGVLAVTGYDGAFANRFYGSVYDTADLATPGANASNNSARTRPPRLNVDLLEKSAQAVVGMLWRLNGRATAAPDVNYTVVRELLTCLTEDINCPLVQSYLPSCRAEVQRRAYPVRSSLYTGVARDRNVKPTTYFIQQFLAEKLSLSAEEGSSMAGCSLDAACNDTLPGCANGETCIPLLDGTKDGVCKRAPVFFHFSHTPAVRVARDNATGASVYVRDERYPNLPVWAEARWNSKRGVRGYRKQTAWANVSTNLILLYIVYHVSGYSGSGATWFHSKGERRVMRWVGVALMVWTVFFSIFGLITQGPAWSVE